MMHLLLVAKTLLLLVHLLQLKQQIVIGETLLNGYGPNAVNPLTAFSIVADLLCVDANISTLS